MVKKIDDASLPNPYDYQSLDLDPNVTTDDLKTLTNYLKKNVASLKPKVRFLNEVDPLLSTDGKRWLFGKIPAITKKLDDWDETEEVTDHKIFTIIDDSKRVGIVRFYDNRVQWVEFVTGKNYSVRGVMKMLDLLYDEKYLIIPNNRIYVIKASAWNMNSIGLEDIKKLKMSEVKKDDVTEYTFGKDVFWWNFSNQKMIEIYYKELMKH